MKKIPKKPICHKKECIIAPPYCIRPPPEGGWSNAKKNNVHNHPLPEGGWLWTFHSFSGIDLLPKPPPQNFHQNPVFSGKLGTYLMGVA